MSAGETYKCVPNQQDDNHLNTPEEETIIEPANMPYFEYSTVAVCTSCLVCGEVASTDIQRHSPKICDKCKASIMRVRSTMDSEEVYQ